MTDPQAERDVAWENWLQAVAVYRGAESRDERRFAWGTLLERGAALEEKVVAAWVEGQAWDPLSSHPCGACSYDDGKLTRTCALHEWWMELFSQMPTDEIVERAERAERELANLLARIFRDGGQRADAYPSPAHAVEAADREVAALFVERDAAWEALRGVVSAYDSVSDAGLKRSADFNFKVDNLDDAINEARAVLPDSEKAEGPADTYEAIGRTDSTDAT